MRTVITGAGRGLGLALARAARARGDEVIGTMRRPSEVLEAIGAQRMALDLADEASIAAFGAALAERTERVDLLIHNAGINSRGVPEGQGNVRLGRLEPEGLLRMARVNAVGPALLTQAVLPLLGQGSRVVAISSWLGSIAGKQRGGNYGYCASKAMLNMVTRALAWDLKERGVVTFAVNPGWMRTDMGGARAALSPEDSAAGILALAERLGPDDVGTFVDHDGTPHAW